MVETPLECAEVAEQADASVSKTDVRKDVRVRLPLSAPRRFKRFALACGFGLASVRGFGLADAPTRPGSLCEPGHPPRQAGRGSRGDLPTGWGGQGRLGLGCGDYAWDHVRLDHRDHTH